MITSILDTDLYKLTMQQAVLQHYPTAVVDYRFSNRGKTLFSRSCYNVVKAAISDLAKVTLSPEEFSWLKFQCSFFNEEYLSFLASFRFRPDTQVSFDFIPERKDDKGVEWGTFEIDVNGLWTETILYEVPLMAIISEARFTTDDTAWDYVGQLELAKQKGKRLLDAGCFLSEFGTRRRRTLASHDIVIQGLIAAQRSYEQEGKESGGKLTGTSNVWFAQKYGLKPIGTIAHEWIMGIAAEEGYSGSNGRAMDLWEKSYPSGVLNIALTDTFSSKPFFDDFISDPERANRWKGLRQDSGDPFKFIPVAEKAFRRVGADPKQSMGMAVSMKVTHVLTSSITPPETIIFSDGLDVEKCLKLKQASDEAGVGCSFGVGTFLTNDFYRVDSPTKQEGSQLGSGDVRTTGEKSKPLNMVIKLYRINGFYCVKISDELTKTTGYPETVQLVMQRFGLEDPKT